MKNCARWPMPRSPARESDWLVGINSTRALTAFNSRHVGGFQKTTAGPRADADAGHPRRARGEDPRLQAAHLLGSLRRFRRGRGRYRGRWFDETFKKGAEEDTRAGAHLGAGQGRRHRGKMPAARPGPSTEEKKPPDPDPAAALRPHHPPARGQLAASASPPGRRCRSPRPSTRSTRCSPIPVPIPATCPRITSAPRRSHGQASPIPRSPRHADEGAARTAGCTRTSASSTTPRSAITLPSSPPASRRRTWTRCRRRSTTWSRGVSSPCSIPQARVRSSPRASPRVEDEKFKTDGKIIVDPGWLEVYGRQAWRRRERHRLVAIAAGETAQTSRPSRSRRTTPSRPPRYNEATLLSAMEGAGKLVDDEELREAMREKGLGTPATRAQIIEGLIFEGYLDPQGPRPHRHRQGHLPHHPAAQCPAPRPYQAGDDRRMGIQAQADGARPALARGLHGPDPRPHPEIVEKVKGFGEKPIEGEFVTLDIDCPKCGGGPFKENYRAYTCASCDLRVWKSMAGREFEPRGSEDQLLTEGRVGPLEGFRSKMGRAFSAVVKLGEENKPEFEFENGSAGNPRATKPWTSRRSPPSPPARSAKPARCMSSKRHMPARTISTAKPGKTCELRIGKVILQKASRRSRCASC